MIKLGLESCRQFFIFTTIVLVKFIFVRSLLFDNSSFLYSLFIEIGYILFIFGSLELLPLKRVKTALYISFNLIFSFLLLAILIYHDYFGHIVTIQAFSQIGQVGTIKDSVLQLVNPIYLLLFADFILFFIYMFLQKQSPTTLSPKTNYKFILPVFAVGFALFSFHIFTQKDARIADTVLAAEKQGILTYEILAVKEKASAKSIPVLSEIEQNHLPNEIQELKQITPLPKEELKLNGIAKDKNIIVIQAEAFQNFPIHLKIDGKEITPFLNQLVDESIYFPNVFQQIGPGNTSDAEFLFNTSLYPDPWTNTSSTIGDREIPSFPRLLKEKDYLSLTFHANDVRFWNRNQLYPALGFSKYYDITFFGQEDVIGIGPSDDYVYKKAIPELKKLHESGQNFYAQIVTLSGHHPFKIPSDKDVIELPNQFKNTLVGDYLQAISYTDIALEQFVQGLKNEGMWEDTILVFYGDHFGLQPSGLSGNDFALLEELIGHEYTFLDQFNIPFIISIPNLTAGETFTTIGSQIDMMPTVANLLDLSLDNHVYFGQDIINYPNNLFGIRYYMPYGSFFNNEIAFRPAENFDDGEAFDIQTGKQIIDYSQYKNDYERLIKLLKLSDDYVKSLPVKF